MSARQARKREKAQRRERRAVWAELAAVGVAGRVDVAQATVATPAFAARLRMAIATAEQSTPLKGLNEVRDVVCSVLREQGVNLDGVVAKLFWSPGTSESTAKLRITFHPDQPATEAAIRATKKGRNLGGSDGGATLH